MTREATRNVSASIRARLLSLAQSRGEDYQRVLGRYAIERFLYRLGRSEYRDNFALKGATLFTLWTGQTHRPTKDLDLDEVCRRPPLRKLKQVGNVSVPYFIN